MRYTLLLSAALMLLVAFAAVGCVARPSGSNWGQHRIVDRVILTPKEVHVNDVVLLHYKLKLVWIPGDNADLALVPHYFAASAGELIPLLDPPYTVGGVLPSFEAAKNAVDNTPGDDFSYGFRGAFDYYAFFKAPSEPGAVLISFFAGNSDSHYPKEAEHSFGINVLP